MVVFKRSSNSQSLFICGLYSYTRYSFLPSFVGLLNNPYTTYHQNRKKSRRLGGMKINYDLHPPHGFRPAFVSKIKRTGGVGGRNSTCWTQKWRFRFRCFSLKAFCWRLKTSESDQKKWPQKKMAQKSLKIYRSTSHSLTSFSRVRSFKPLVSKSGRLKILFCGPQ